MAWIDIPNKTGWQYDNSVDNSRTVTENGEEVYITYKDSPGVIANGIRTYTNESGQTCEVYVRCRQTAHPDKILGEVSKTYWDNQS